MGEIIMKYYVYSETKNFYIERAKRISAYNMLCQHYHRSYEFLFVLDGKRYIFFNDKTYELKRGDLVVLDPYTIHYTESKDSEYAEIYAMNLNIDFLSPLFSENEAEKQIHNIHSCVLHLDEKLFADILQLFTQMNNCVGMSEPFCTKILRSYIFVFLNKINTICKKESLTVNEKHGTEYSNDFTKAISYIVKNYKKDINLNFICDYVHMSKSHFCHLFSKETGSTFLQYVNNLRISEAHRLLLETDMKIHEISDNVGFHSVAQMTRVFKSIHGVSPSQLRKKHMK